MKYINSINLNKSFSNKQILKNVNFICKKGEITGIIGPNGSGKSSIFKILSGLWDYKDGCIYFDDTDFASDYNNIVKNIGGFIENPNLYDDLTPRQNFKIINEIYKCNNNEWYGKLIKIFEIDKFMDVKIKKCSLGMKQKVGIVVSILHNPDIIILDEPTNSLDITSVKRLHDLLLSIKHEKIIIISSHILEELDSICDKVYMIDKGEIISSSDYSDSNIYTLKIDTIIKNKMNFEKCRIIEQIDEVTIRIECLDLNSLFSECSEKNIKIINIKNESVSKNLFNKIVGE